MNTRGSHRTQDDATGKTNTQIEFIAVLEISMRISFKDDGEGAWTDFGSCCTDSFGPPQGLEP